MRYRGVLVIAAAVLTTVTGCVPGSDSEPTAAPSPPDCSAVKNMAIAAWADHAGIVPDDRSLSTWVEEHPDRSRFAPLPDDAPLDVAALWQQREQQPDRWDDLVTYMQNEGLRWLLESDLDEVVPIMDDDDTDPLGWRTCG